MRPVISWPSEGVLSEGGLDGEAIKSMEKVMEGEAETEEKERDEKVLKGIQGVVKMMKEG